MNTRLLGFRFASFAAVPELQHGRFLAFAKLGQEHDLAVREFKIVMDVGVACDLAEDRRVVLDVLDAAAEDRGDSIAISFASDLSPAAGTLPWCVPPAPKPVFRCRNSWW
jgi:hypothetical protein